MIGKQYKIGAGPILRPRELRISHQDEKMQVSIKNDFQGERKVFYHRKWLTVGLPVDNGV